MSITIFVLGGNSRNLAMERNWCRWNDWSGWFMECFLRSEPAFVLMLIVRERSGTLGIAYFVMTVTSSDKNSGCCGWMVNWSLCFGRIALLNSMVVLCSLACWHFGDASLRDRSSSLTCNTQNFVGSCLLHCHLLNPLDDVTVKEELNEGISPVQKWIFYTIEIAVLVTTTRLYFIIQEIILFMVVTEEDLAFPLFG